MIEEIYTVNSKLVDLIYEDELIKISYSKIKFKGETISIKDVINTEINSIRKRMIVFYIALLAGVIIGFLGLMMDSYSAISFGGITISGSITWLIFATFNEHTLVLITNADKIETVSSRDSNYIQMLQDLLKNDNNSGNKFFSDEAESQYVTRFSDYVFISLLIFCSLYAVYDLFLD